MTIASELTKLNTNLTNSYTAINGKGGTLPSTRNFDNLATAISSIPSGGSTPIIESLSVTPTTSAQTIIAPSGTDGYSPVNVSAVTSSIDTNIVAGNIKNGVSILGVIGTYEGSGGGNAGYIPREVSQQGVYQMPTTSFTFSLPSNATDIGSYGLQYAFSYCTGLTNVDLSYLTTISGYNGLYSTFNSCTSLTSINLSSLTTVSGSYGLYYAFSYCTGLTSVDLPLLTTVSGSYGLQYAFQNCTGLISVDLSSLTTISGDYGLASTFRGCTVLTSISFPVLITIGKGGFSNIFYGCIALTNVYFPALTTTSFGSYTNQFQNMLSNTGSNVTHTIHFPSNLESTIQGLTSYPNFGGTSGYITLAFDLPATS